VVRYEQWKLTVAKYSYYNDPYWWTPRGFIRRLSFWRGFIATPFIDLAVSNESLVNPADVDKSINTVALVSSALHTTSLSIVVLFAYRTPHLLLSHR
jgi:hypothetical protein